jgi:hypothetical protein
MKELKSYKEPKKKPGEFQKSKKKNKNIQHNRDQIKLLREYQIQLAELFILDDDGFKKVSIIEMPSNHDARPLYAKVVFLSSNGRGHRLRTGYYADKNAGDRCKLSNGEFIEWKQCFGIVISTEMLKENDN